MTILKPLLPLAATASLALCLLWSGCGIITAPVSGPAAVAANTNFSYDGPLLDQDGNPLDAVLLSQELSHHFWTPIEGGTDTDEHHLRRFDRTYKVDERGEFLRLGFSHEGFYDSNLEINASDAGHIQAAYSSSGKMTWPSSKNFPVVLLSRNKPDARLQHWSGCVNYDNYPKANGIDLNSLLKRTGPQIPPNSTENLAYPPGTLYLNLIKTTPKPIDAQGDIDPAEVNIPQSITLHIAGENPGFLRIQPKLGFPPIQTNDTAPTANYAPELTIDHKRLKEMRTAVAGAVIESHEFFFFRAGDRYGKAILSWTQSVTKDDKSVLPMCFRFQIWLQPKPNETDLTSRDTATD